MQFVVFKCLAPLVVKHPANAGGAIVVDAGNKVNPIFAAGSNDPVCRGNFDAISLADGMVCCSGMEIGPGGRQSGYGLRHYIPS